MSNSQMHTEVVTPALELSAMSGTYYKTVVLIYICHIPYAKQHTKSAPLVGFLSHVRNLLENLYNNVNLSNLKLVCIEINWLTKHILVK